MSELQIKLEEIKRQKDTYIIPENIKKDITVYGVTGTYEGSGGSGDVKLFDTVEHMQQDPAAQEGDLAVVYGEKVQGVTAKSEFSSCKFPSSVSLPTAFTDSVYCGFRQLDSSDGWFDAQVEVSNTEFRFNGYSDEGMIQVSYSSSDGINYVRNDSGDETINFGTVIKCDRENEFNDVLSYFMLASSKNFNGLYQYVLNRQTEEFKFRDFTSSNISISDNKVTTFSVENILNTSFNYIQLKKILEKYSLHDFSTFYIDENNNLKVISTSFENIGLDSNGNFIGLVTNSTQVGQQYSLYTVNLNNMEIVLDTTYNSISFANNEYTQYVYIPITNIKSLPITLGNAPQSLTRNECYAMIEGNTQSARTCEEKNLSIYKNMYVSAPNQLTLNNSNQLLPNTTAYGNKDIIIGDISIYDNLDISIILQKFMNMPEVVSTDSYKIYGKLNDGLIIPTSRAGYIKYYKKSNNGTYGIAKLIEKENYIVKYSSDNTIKLVVDSTNKIINIYNVSTGNIINSLSPAQYIGFKNDKLYYTKIDLSLSSGTDNSYYTPLYIKVSDATYDPKIYCYNLLTNVDNKLNFMTVSSSLTDTYITHQYMWLNNVLIYACMTHKTASSGYDMNVITQLYNLNTNSLVGDNISFTKNVERTISNHAATAIYDQNDNVYIWYCGLESASYTDTSDIYKYNNTTNTLTKIKENVVVSLQYSPSLSMGYMDNNNNCLYWIYSDAAFHCMNLNTLVVSTKNCYMITDGVKEKFKNLKSLKLCNGIYMCVHYNNAFRTVNISVDNLTGDILLTTNKNIYIGVPYNCDSTYKYSQFANWIYNFDVYNNKIVIRNTNTQAPKDISIEFYEESNISNYDIVTLNTLVSKNITTSNTLLLKGNVE